MSVFSVTDIQICDFKNSIIVIKLNLVMILDLCSSSERSQRKKRGARVCALKSFNYYNLKSNDEYNSLL